MHNWQVTSLGSIATFRTGKLDSNAAEDNGMYPFFTCSPETYRINTYAFDTEAVLLAGNNANAVYPIKYYKGKFNAYQRTYVIEPKSAELADCRYLYYLISFLLQKLKEASVGSATKFLTKQILENFQVDVPPLEEQKAIARILSSLDDKIELNRRMNATLEAMARALFKAWFVDFEPVHANIENRPSTSASPEIAKLFPSDFENGIPKGWRVGMLGDISVNVRQNVDPFEIDSDTPYVGLEHVPRKSLGLTEWSTASSADSTKTKFQRNDVLFGKLRPYFHKVVVAPVDGVCSTDILVIRPKQDEFFGQVLMEFSSDAIIQYADKLSNGAKMPRTNWKDLAKFETVISRVQIAEKFSVVVRSMTDRMISNIEETKTLERLRDVILPRLISGRIRVSDFDKGAGI